VASILFFPAATHVWPIGDGRSKSEVSEEPQLIDEKWGIFLVPNHPGTRIDWDRLDLEGGLVVIPVLTTDNWAA